MVDLKINLKIKKCGDTKLEISESKGIMSAAAFFITISIFLIAQIYLLNNIRTRTLTSDTLISNRVYYLYDSIRKSAADIIEVELGNITQAMTLNVTIDEQENFTYVNFTEKFPQDTSAFKKDMSKYDAFAENYLNESNLKINTSIDGLGGKMESVIYPYGIIYTHTDQWGNGDKREYEIIPGDGLDELNGYKLTVHLLDGWKVMPERAIWGPLKLGDLNFNMTVISTGGNPTYSTEQLVSRIQKSTFKIDANITNSSGYYEGWVRAIISDVNPGGLLFQMHMVHAIVSTGLNLTEVPGQTEVSFPEGKINVTETLYNIQKNGTVRTWYLP